MASYYTLQERISRDIWTKKDGTTLHIKDMTDGHLDNAIKHIERGAYVFGFGSEWLPKLKKELSSRSSIQKMYKYLKEYGCDLLK